MTPDEIMRLPGPTKNAKGDILTAGEMLIFVAGLPVIRGRQILYFLDPTFSERSRIKPPPTDRILSATNVRKTSPNKSARFVVQ